MDDPCGHCAVASVLDFETNYEWLPRVRDDLLFLEFDPQTRRLGILTLEAKDAYYQVAYLHSANN